MIGALPAMTQEKPKQWTTKELAAAGNVDPGYIRQMLIAGKLDGYKWGRDWVIPDSEAKRWLASRNK